MAEVEVNGIMVHYEERGGGPSLVLVHGLGGTTALWTPIASELAREFRVITYDLRGAGATDRPAGPYSLELLVEDLAGLTEALELAPMILVGHSMSGGLVLAYAAEHPGDVAAVVGVGAVTDLPDAARDGMRERAEVVRGGGMSDVARAVAENGTDPSWRQRDGLAFSDFRQSIASNDPEGYALLALVVAELDVSAQLGQVQAPVLLVAGETDPVSPPERNLANVELIPDATYASLPETGHIIPLERPLELLAALRPFARSHAGLEDAG
jgi:pimeloyl-ACP methyl ester carboxylesterase